MQEYTLPDRRALYERAGRYYEAEDDIVHALECYSQGACTHKVTALLERHAALHPGIGHYYETERFYRALPEEDLLKSPTLMCGMSMLCALVMDYEGSERWYGELQKFAEHCDRQDAAGKQARGRLAWLDISLPQRGVNGLAETIPTVFSPTRRQAARMGSLRRAARAASMTQPTRPKSNRSVHRKTN